MRRPVAILLAGLVLAGVFTALEQQAAADHFASRRRDAELRRQQAAQAPQLRPWGGPTTGRAFWKPAPKGRHIVVTPRAFAVPNGRFVWFRGRRIFVPYRSYAPYSPYFFSGPQHIHIERYVR